MVDIRTYERRFNFFESTEFYFLTDNASLLEEFFGYGNAFVVKGKKFVFAIYSKSKIS